MQPSNSPRDGDGKRRKGIMRKSLLILIIYMDYINFFHLCLFVYPNKHSFLCNILQNLVLLLMFCLFLLICYHH